MREKAGVAEGKGRVGLPSCLTCVDKPAGILLNIHLLFEAALS